MSDRMNPVPFETLLDWVFGELSAEGSVFGCKHFYRAAGEGQPYMGRTLETAVGPAAGPHTQLAQNIAAAYVCGARMFELKTAQIIDGEALVVSKPCILVRDEGYNCEWSTELTVEQARDEYIKAWFLLHVLAVELQLGRTDGFVFNMSVGYDLDGIRSPKIDRFLNDLRDASRTEMFCHCADVLKDRLARFQHFGAAELAAISPAICDSVTISTMHGCPPAETEKIALYLLEEKKLNLLLKCNPTLVGYDEARRALDRWGFARVQIERESFDNDLQYADAVPMLERLQARAAELGLYFAVKLTNTLPVRSQGALPDEMMYMSGRALLPLSLCIAARLSQDFHGTLPISYCGGANARNIALLRRAGLFPITVCTELLKPGGYGKLHAMATALEGLERESIAPLFDALEQLPDALIEAVAEDPLPKDIRAALSEPSKASTDCRVTCGVCASVCPNRANVIITVDGRKQMLHIDALCNECGNCATFCTERAAPYRDKLTVFADEASLKASQNTGFAFLRESGKFLLRQDGVCREVSAEDADATLRAVLDRYPWLIRA